MIYEALINIQEQLKAPKSQTNKFGGYQYRSCEDILTAVKPLLKANGCVLTISDEIVEVGNRVYVKAIATLSNPPDNIHVTAFAREAETKKGMDEAQITGSASSYARKYALNGLFAIDDTKDPDATNDHGKGGQRQKQENPKPVEKISTDQALLISDLCTELNLKKPEIKKMLNWSKIKHKCEVIADIATTDYGTVVTFLNDKMKEKK